MDALREFSRFRTRDWINFEPSAAVPKGQGHEAEYQYFRLVSPAEPLKHQPPGLIPGTDSLTNIIRESDRLASTPDLEASFLLVCAPRRFVDTVGFSQPDFERLVEGFGIDPWVANGFCLGEFGLHWIQSPNGQNLSYCLILYHYTVIWSYHAKTSRTRALLAVPTSADSAGAENFLDMNLPFTRLLKQAGPSNLHSPVLLAWVTLVCLLDAHMADIGSDGTELRGAEYYTRHSPFLPSKVLEAQNDALTIEMLSEWSQRVGAIIGNQAKLAWQITIGFEVAQHIKEPRHPTAIPHGKGGDSLADTIPHLERVLGAANSALKRFQKRADVQLTVISALMAHEDTKASNALAEASTRIAEESKKDASSMKTIAIMTMAFLPATYFAALWAMPAMDAKLSSSALNGNGNGNGSEGPPSQIIIDSFGLYWAVTLPVTGLVFLVWFGLNATREKRRWRDEEIEMGNWSGLFHAFLPDPTMRRRRRKRPGRRDQSLASSSYRPPDDTCTAESRLGQASSPKTRGGGGGGEEWNEELQQQQQRLMYRTGGARNPATDPRYNRMMSSSSSAAAAAAAAAQVVVTNRPS